MVCILEQLKIGSQVLELTENIVSSFLQNSKQLRDNHPTIADMAVLYEWGCCTSCNSYGMATCPTDDEWKTLETELGKCPQSDLYITGENHTRGTEYLQRHTQQI